MRGPQPLPQEPSAFANLSPSRPHTAPQQAEPAPQGGSAKVVFQLCPKLTPGYWGATEAT